MRNYLFIGSTGIPACDKKQAENLKYQNFKFKYINLNC